MKKYSFAGLLSLCVSLLLLSSCMQPQPSTYPDGMLRGVPEDYGVSSHCILDFVEELENQGLEMHSFMFMRRGRVLAEGYWSPYKADMNHVMYSVSKTFASTAIGFTVKEKKLSVDDKVISFFPDDLPPVLSPNLEKLTIKHLLTMTVGHETAPVFYMEDDNWVKRFLATPIVHEPGKVFLYNTYATYMLSAILQKVTGQTMLEYLQPRLFDPLNIDGAVWENGQDNISAGGWGLSIKTADMMKLGRLYLQKGKWNKKKLLPESWIKEASSVHIFQVDEPTFEQEMYDEGAQGYGYQIWRSRHNAYRAAGANGQFILVMPDQEAVMVTTARVSDSQRILSLFWEYLYPGIMPKMQRKNYAARDALVSKLASLHLEHPFLTEEEDFVRKDTTFAYTMEENEAGITTASFAFDKEGVCKLTLDGKGSPYSFDFGYDIWRYGKTEKMSPYYLNTRRNPEEMQPYSVAGFGSWTAKDELSLRLCYLVEAEYETYICNFTPGKVAITLSNSMQPGDSTIITGSIKER